MLPAVSREPNGLGLAVSDALDNARASRSRLLLLAEDAKVADRLAGLIEDTGSSGKEVHDHGDFSARIH
jgi:hypothetical protein